MRPRLVCGAPLALITGEDDQPGPVRETLERTSGEKDVRYLSGNCIAMGSRNRPGHHAYPSAIQARPLALGEPEEETIVAMKLALAAELRRVRQEKGLTQQELAQHMGSSQSRVAKMEAADPTVSMELFVRSLSSLGETRQQIGAVIGATPKTPRPASGRKKTSRAAA